MVLSGVYSVCITLLYYSKQIIKCCMHGYSSSVMRLLFLSQVLLLQSRAVRQMMTTVWISPWIFLLLPAPSKGGDGVTCPRNQFRFFGTGCMSTATMPILQNKKRHYCLDRHTFPHYRYLRIVEGSLKQGCLVS